MAALSGAADDLARSISLSRSSSGSRSWRQASSFREIWNSQPDVFSRSRRMTAEDDEEELKWAAIERLPTYDRLRKGMLTQVMSNGRIERNEVDVTNLRSQDKKLLMENILKVVEEDNEKFLLRLRNRIDSSGILNPGFLGMIGLSPSKKRVVKILQDVSGIVKPSRFFRHFLALFGVHQVALSLFRFISAVGRTPVLANTLGTFTLLLVFVLGGFIVSKDDIKPWMIWGYYVSPMMYGQNAIAINEFLDERWSTPVTDSSQPTVGKTLLKERGLFVDEYWYWICIGALMGFSLLFNVLFVLALTFLNPLGDSKAVILEDNSEDKPKSQSPSSAGGVEMAIRNAQASTSSTVNAADNVAKRGMVLPFKPLSLAFNHVNYYVDMPAMIPVWWRWYYWASPVAWTIYGIFTSQIGDKKNDLEIPGMSSKIQVDVFLKKYLGFNYDFLIPVVIAHLGWVLLFFFVFAYGIKFLNFQRR
ncbi:ABC-2 type transporter [Dillenia turbinata]|uniref:ABC-2 type transporter n=1 Tax=Dillenia turbinata TaxID=194707 RepID=A0AAN8V176_9MAGN